MYPMSPMISRFGGNNPLPSLVGYGQPRGYGQRTPSGAMREGLANLRGLGDVPIVGDIGAFIQGQAAQGATSAVQPYIMGALALSAGALIISLISLSNSRKSSKSLSGARRR